MTKPMLTYFTILIFLDLTSVLSDNVTDKPYLMEFPGKFKQICKTKRCVWKCCPEGTYLFGRIDDKACMRPVNLNGYRNLNFSEVNLYTKKLARTGKRLKDVYTIVPGAYLNEHFKNNSYDYSNLINHEYYLTEESILLDIAPNQYINKFELDNRYFCADYQLDVNLTIVGASYWAILDNGDSTNESESDSVRHFNVAGMMISSFFLVLVLVIYCLLPELRNLSGMILMAYVASMIGSFLLLAVIQMDQYKEIVCLLLSYGAYFFTIATFCWMTVMSYDFWSLNCKHLYNRKRSQRSALSKFRIHCCFAFGLSGVLTLFLIIVNHINLRHLPFFITPHVAKQACFIAGRHKLLYLYIPMLILILANWAFFLLSSCALWREFRATSMLDKEAKAGGSRLTHRSQLNRFFLYLKLSIIMGINWLLEVVSSFYPDWNFWYITDLYNMLVGFSIFIIFICNRTIYKKLIKKYRSRKSLDKTEVEVDSI